MEQVQRKNTNKTGPKKNLKPNCKPLKWSLWDLLIKGAF